MSDGIIAPGFEPAALEILKAKKGGKYIVLQADPHFEPPEIEQVCPPPLRPPLHPPYTPP